MVQKTNRYPLTHLFSALLALVILWQSPMTQADANYIFIHKAGLTTPLPVIKSNIVADPATGTMLAATVAFDYRYTSLQVRMTIPAGSRIRFDWRDDEGERCTNEECITIDERVSGVQVFQNGSWVDWGELSYPKFDKEFRPYRVSRYIQDYPKSAYLDYVGIIYGVMYDRQGNVTRLTTPCHEVTFQKRIRNVNSIWYNQKNQRIGYSFGCSVSPWPTQTIDHEDLHVPGRVETLRFLTGPFRGPTYFDSHELVRKGRIGTRILYKGQVFPVDAEIEIDVLGGLKDKLEFGFVMAPTSLDGADFLYNPSAADTHCRVDYLRDRASPTESRVVHFAGVRRFFDLATNQFVYLDGSSLPLAFKYSYINCHYQQKVHVSQLLPN